MNCVVLAWPGVFGKSHKSCGLCYTSNGHSASADISWRKLTVRTTVEDPQRLIQPPCPSAGMTRITKRAESSHRDIHEYAPPPIHLPPADPLNMRHCAPNAGANFSPSREDLRRSARNFTIRYRRQTTRDRGSTTQGGGRGQGLQSTDRSRLKNFRTATLAGQRSTGRQAASNGSAAPSRKSSKRRHALFSQASFRSAKRKPARHRVFSTPANATGNTSWTR